MEVDGCSTQQARDNIWMMDIDGLLVKDRPEGNLEGHKIWYAKKYKVMKSLFEVVKEIKPSVLIGEWINIISFFQFLNLSLSHSKIIFS